MYTGIRFSDQDPTYEQDDPDKMIYILFDRQHAEDHTLLFLRPNTSQLVDIRYLKYMI